MLSFKEEGYSGFLEDDAHTHQIRSSNFKRRIEGQPPHVRYFLSVKGHFVAVMRIECVLEVPGAIEFSILPPPGASMLPSPPGGGVLVEEELARLLGRDEAAEVLQQARSVSRRRNLLWRDLQRVVVHLGKREY
jgi:hypothetical protein